MTKRDIPKRHIVRTIKRSAAQKKKNSPGRYSNPIVRHLESKAVLIRDFAWKLKVTEQAVRNWIARTNSPSIASRIKISQEFGISLKDFNTIWDAWELPGQDDGDLK